MAIKMKVGMAGVNFSVSVGDVTDRFSEAEEARLIATGYAEAVDGEGNTEEKATPKPRRKGN